MRWISIHALREEGDLYRRIETARKEVFLSTPSARRATLDSDIAQIIYKISIHALREEGDQLLIGADAVFNTFLSTPSARRATGIGHHFRQEEGISIHALREEGDAPRGTINAAVQNFYPRPPRGGRQPVSAMLPKFKLFLSTPSARRATLHG